MLAWLRHNLFSTWYNTLLTLLCLWLLWQVVPPLLQWALFDADFSRHQPRRLHFRGRVLGVHQGALLAVHVRLLPGRSALARQSRVPDPDRRAGSAVPAALSPQARARRRHPGVLPDRRLLPVLRRGARPAGGRDRAVGRAVPDPGDRRRRHRRLLAARHPVRARAGARTCRSCARCASPSSRSCAACR